MTVNRMRGEARTLPSASHQNGVVGAFGMLLLSVRKMGSKLDIGIPQLLPYWHFMGPNSTRGPSVLSMVSAHWGPARLTQPCQPVSPDIASSHQHPWLRATYSLISCRMFATVLFLCRSRLLWGVCMPGCLHHLPSTYGCRQLWRGLG